MSKYYCKDCGKPVNNNRIVRCRECYIISTQGTNNIHYIKGKSFNNKCKCGQLICFNATLCPDCYHETRRTGKNYSRCKECNKILTYLSKQPRRCRSCASKGKLNCNYGRPPKHGKGGYYKGIYMRSSYELKYAKYLDDNNIKWEYEPKAFEIIFTYKGIEKEGTYSPDFHLLESDTWVELKGWWRNDAKEKYEAFKEQYKDIKIKLLMRPELKEMGVL